MATPLKVPREMYAKVEADSHRMDLEGKKAEWFALDSGPHEVDWLIENGYHDFAEYWRIIRYLEK